MARRRIHTSACRSVSRAPGVGRPRLLVGASLVVAAFLAAVATVGPPAVAASHVGSSTASAGPGAGLHVIPFPGTADASTQSRVIFSSLAPSELRSVTVRGSGSGSHEGRVVRLPDGAGSAFIPDQRFRPGEKVQVTARLSSPAAGTRSGDPGAATLRFAFTIAVPASPSAAASQAGPANDSSGAVNAPTYHFRSQVDFHPPVVSFGPNPDTSSGEIFLAPDHQSQSGPMIVDRTGHLVWFHPISNDANIQAKGLQMQMYQGRWVLTWWQGRVFGKGTRHPEDVILGHSYRNVAVVHAGDGYNADDHEFQITPQNTALLDAVTTVRRNLTSVGGSAHGSVMDAVIQEIDIHTGQVLWEWHALGHIPLSASYDRPPASKAYDYCHFNSIQQVSGGNLLISCRNTWGVYLISKRTGKVIWSIGGKHSSFKMGPGTKFEWQHDPRLAGQTLTLFDDAFDGVANHQEEGQSSAEALHINTSAKTVTLLHRYTHSPPLLSSSQGSAQMLHNQNIFVGWGNQPNFSEYTSSGRQIFSGSLPLGLDSYRAFRFVWAGHPAVPPTMAIAPQRGGAVKVYASWNGATQVVAWRVVGGSDKAARHQFGTGRRTGFESVITIHSRPAYLEVQALSRRNHVLGTSHPHPFPH